MKIGKNEKKQVKLVEDWNIMHPVGIDVIVTKDDKTEQRTKTHSAAYMLGASEDYPGHTAVIMLDGIAGCYALERVREANSNKMYRFEGNINYKSRKYCKRHFIEKYGREPNILDVACFGLCNHRECK